ncbi:SIP domain-containing protein [Kribbella capetownensis]|uniref:SIP domain-containing protein n=1 Tax=Kribbella capetownensis TaxID=1572659 RepID=UPI0013F3FA23|nr:SIP domain-containing protein [Kribbella capetownensis]
MGHGWEGVVLKLFRGKDFVLTVTGAGTSHDADHSLPFRIDPERHELRPIPRPELVASVKTDLPKLLGDASDAYVWIACDTATTRALTTYVLKDLAVPKHRVKALGYWKAA